MSVLKTCVKFGKSDNKVPIVPSASDTLFISRLLKLR